MCQPPFSWPFGGVSRVSPCRPEKYAPIYRRRPVALGRALCGRGIGTAKGVFGETRGDWLTCYRLILRLLRIIMDSLRGWCRAGRMKIDWVGERTQTCFAVAFALLKTWSVPYLRVQFCYYRRTYLLADVQASKTGTDPSGRVCEGDGAVPVLRYAGEKRLLFRLGSPRKGQSLLADSRGQSLFGFAHNAQR